MTKRTLKILVTGDLCPINRIEYLAAESDFSSIFNDFIVVMKDNDLNITDLECPLTTSKASRRKIGPHQKAHPDCIKVLSHAGINLVTLANNHIMDYGTEGLVETLEICKSNNISTVGIGRNVREAGEPFITSINTARIAILNCADNEFVTAPDKSYTCNYIDPIALHDSITGTRGKVDYLIVIVHAGNEYYSLPSPRTKALYRFLIDCGADAVVASHSHAFSGYEIYKSRPIFYGLGNFVYDWPGKTEASWYRGYVVRLILSDTVEFEIIPLRQGIKEPGVFQLNESEYGLFFDDLERLNTIISDDLLLEREFNAYCDAVLPMYDAYIEPYFGRFATALRNRKFLPKLMTKRKRLLLLNMIRCESHREVLTTLLRKYE